MHSISQGGKEAERVSPVIIRKVIKELYKVSFCLLGNFDRWKYNSTMSILKNISSRMKKVDLFRLRNIAQS